MNIFALNKPECHNQLKTMKFMEIIVPKIKHVPTEYRICMQPNELFVILFSFWDFFYNLRRFLKLQGKYYQFNIKFVIQQLAPAYFKLLELIKHLQHYDTLIILAVLCSLRRLTAKWMNWYLRNIIQCSESTYIIQLIKIMNSLDSVSYCLSRCSIFVEF